ncbi:unnamed protein product [Paramecium primaurelia]|uniref:Uncharacterized protein n=1 Tax=Paramecium primaurelia TaxID=5886 RepID=A0A8S1L9D1_PARPR|nr:unnamed protein product [Paramecium primaurelia]
MCFWREFVDQKSVKWNIQNYTRNQQEYYKIFFNCEDQFLKDSSKFNGEMSDIERNKQEDNLIYKIIKIIGDSFDDLKIKLLQKNRIIFSIVYSQLSLIAIELILDQQIIHKNIVKIIEIEFLLIFKEKQQKDDLKKIMDRIIHKWRQLQQL